MARIKKIQALHTTRAALNAQKAASGLLQGEPYLITDESRLAVGTAANNYADMATRAELMGNYTPSGVLGWQALYNYPIPFVGAQTMVPKIIWLFEDALAYQQPTAYQRGYIAAALTIIAISAPGSGSAINGLMDVVVRSGTNQNGFISVAGQLAAAFNLSTPITPVRVLISSGTKNSYRYGVLISRQLQGSPGFFATGHIHNESSIHSPFYPYITDHNYYEATLGAYETVPNADLSQGGRAYQINGSPVLTPRNITFADLANAGAAPLASPALTGTPTAPTAAAGTSTTQLATTAFVQQATAPAPVVVTANATVVLTGLRAVYACDTQAGSFTLTLPASPAAGTTVKVRDYKSTFAVNNLTVARNGKNILGLAEDYILDVSNYGREFVYIDATMGWSVQ